MPRLTIITQGFAGQSCDLPDGHFTLGRSPENHLVFCDSTVSAHHCELLIFGAEVIVRDKDSKNGTYVNGDRLHGQSGVMHRQIISLGRIDVRVEMDPPEMDSVTRMSAVEDLRELQRQAGREVNELSFPITFAPV